MKYLFICHYFFYFVIKMYFLIFGLYIFKNICIMQYFLIIAYRYVAIVFIIKNLSQPCVNQCHKPYLFVILRIVNRYCTAETRRTAVRLYEGFHYLQGCEIMLAGAYNIVFFRETHGVVVVRFSADKVNGQRTTVNSPWVCITSARLCFTSVENVCCLLTVVCCPPLHKVCCLLTVVCCL